MIRIEKMDEFTKSKKYKPTPAQWQAISLTGADVLVAAAAGSGKTEVLSERIARKVTLNRWDIDKILVLTFTTAAAKNMLVRIENKISERLLESNSQEDSIFLRKQRMLMNSAYVSTIDSFCLQILKKFYYLVEEDIDGEKKYLSPNFSILSNSKNLLLEVAREVLEKLARDERSIADSLFDVFGDKNSILLSISDMYYKLLTIPNFEDYLENGFSTNIEKTLLKFPIYEDIIERYSNILDLTTKENIKIAKGFAKFIKVFLEKYEEENIIEVLLSDSLLDNTKKEKIKKYFATENNEFNKSLLEKKEKLNDIISLFNIELEKQDNVFDAEALNNVFGELGSYFDVFKTLKYADKFSYSYKVILTMVHKEFIKRKRASNFLDFSDLNHLAIKALTKYENGKVLLSEAAEYYRNYFLEIYVDEYQDNNNLQEYILNLIKGEGVNFFRVGDVKQAIYGFRGSNPELFEEKYNNYEKLAIDNYNTNEDYAFPKNKDGVCIILKENFRSEENILKSSNYVFNRLMENKNSGVSYDEQSALYYPAVKEKKEEIYPTRLINGKANYFTKEDVDKKEYRKQSIENIAYEILRGVKNGKKYSDYAILVRNSSKMNIYKEIFAKYNIPLFFKEKVGFTSSICFNLLYNIFRFLDNTTRDASLVAILHNEIFDYSNDELLYLSLQEGKTLFEKLVNSTKIKDKETVNLLNKWLNFSLNNSLVDTLERISSDVDFKNYLVTIEINDEEVDYYENFIDIVREYQNLDNKLGGFVLYLKNIKDDEIFETKKRTPTNSVTLSTIHISKGLEYKEVFVADLDTTFSKRGYEGEVLFTQDFGFSVNIKNLCERYNIKLKDNNNFTELHKLNSILIKMREREEEVRNLYVALTRAEKVLYLVSPNGVVLNAEQDEGKNIYDILMEKENFEQILTNVFVTYEDYKVDNEKGASIKEYEVEDDDEIFEDTEVYFDLNSFYKNFKEKNISKVEQKKVENKHNKIFPAKTSYSSLKKINNNDIKIRETKKKSYLELSTLTKTTTASKAIMRGNIIHKLFERIVNDIRFEVNISNVDSYLESLVKTTDLLKNIKEQRILEEEEYNLIDNDGDKEKIYNFINSDLIKKIKDAIFCQTEVAFTTLKKAEELYIDSSSDSNVILQGVVDLLVSANEQETFIVDYKTDNVIGKKAEEVLIARHKEQLRIYKEAVESYYNIKSVKTYIYSYALSKLVLVD